MDDNYGHINYLSLSYKADSLIKKFLIRHDSVLSSGSFSDDDISFMHEKLSYLYNILFSSFHRTSFILGYLRTLLYYVLTLPTELNAEKHFVSALYDSLNIIDDITFYISQVTSDVFSGDIIKKYLSHIEKTDSFIRDSMFLSRVNKSSVLEKLDLDINTVSLQELYYGISTGYFYFCEWKSETYERLVELVGHLGEVSQEEITNASMCRNIIDDGNPIAILIKLKSQGFISNISRFMTIVE